MKNRTDTVEAENTQPLVKDEEKAFIKSSEDQTEDNITSSELTDVIGDGGLWQIKITLLSLLASLTTPWNHLGMSFLAYPSDHWCARPVGSNISLEIWWTHFLPNATMKGKEQHSQCEMYIFDAVTGTSTAPCESYEYANNLNTVITEWDLVCSREWLLSTSQTAYMMGFLVAVFISGHLADTYGRHPVFMGNCAIQVVAGMTAAFSTSFVMFAICRFFIAIGYGGNGLIAYIILIETLGTKYRVRYMFIQGLGWIIGYMSFPLIAWLQPDWFYLQLIMTLPSLLYVAYFWLLPESPRWLLAKGYLNKALPIMADAVKANGKVVPNLEAKAILLIELNSEERKGTITVLDLFRTPHLRMKTLYLYFIWIVIAFTYFGLSLNTNELAGNSYVNFSISGFMEILATIFCICTLDRFGRKKSLVFSLFISGLACTAGIFVPDGFPIVETSLAMIGKLFNASAFSTVYVLSAEIFPTVARNVGLGSSSTVARVGSALAPFMKDLSYVTSPSVPILLFGFLSLIASALVLILPETRGHPIPESIDQAEKFGKKTSIKAEEQEMGGFMT